jgi:light-independent protochlorophyllide reductase B subunit
MIRNSSKAAHRPDSLAGIVAAFEGIRDGFTLLNAPIGCKYPLGYTSGLLAPHITPTGPTTFEDFYFGQSRLPCSYADEQDFVYGTEEKITPALRLLDSRGYNLIGVVNHSGTSLIGDDLCRIIEASKIKARTMVVDSSGFTGTYAEGFKVGTTKILERLAGTKKQTVPYSVNIVGPTVFHYNWENDVAELKQTLNALGIKVLSVICAGETIANLERAGEAALNLVVYEEYADSIVRFLEKEYGTPSVGLDMSAPIGLGPSEAWFRSVADFFHVSPKCIDSESTRVRMKCFSALSRISNGGSNLRGTPFSVFGDSSQVFSLVRFLYEYLGMYPVIVGIREVGSKNFAALKNYITVNSLDTSLLIDPDQYEIMDSLKERTPALVFGSNIEEHLSTMADETREFIPIAFPNYDKILLTARPLMGFDGVLALVEDVLASYRCYQIKHRNLFPYA